jgi:glucose-6-phosphate isomerase
MKSLLKKKQSEFLKPEMIEIPNLKGFEDVVVIGMGGSILGAKTLFETLKPPYWNLNHKPRMFFVDNLDIPKIKELGKTIKKGKTLFVIISKSGGTLEVFEAMKILKPDWKKTLIVTEENSGRLHKLAQKNKAKIFYIPKNISGRFSVFTAAGLVPAALAGINIEKLIKGAKKVKIEGKPLTLAKAHYKAARPITVIFPYSSQFSTFNEWYKQLLAESLGKKVSVGLTPVSAIGPKDQHSLLQLFSAGPKDKFIIFVEIESAGKVVSAQKKATEKVLTKKRQKNITLKLKKLDEENIGELLMTMMAKVALMGELYGVNAFNQPGVEECKKLTKKFLGKS